MFSDKRNILQLVSLMRKDCIDHVVLCPGSRNAPLVHTFVDAGFHCHEVTDERSAGFFALGLAECLDRPVAVCCTSGSAVLDLLPAVSEAYYHPLPLLVITADRPERWVGQMDGQTLPQFGAFGRLVRHAVQLPEPSWNDDDAVNAEEVWHCNRLINEALAEMKRWNGPVHINVPISEPLFNFTRTELPDERIVRLSKYACNYSGFALSEEMKDELSACRRVMIVVGQLTPAEARRLSPLVKRLPGCGCVVVAEVLSNLHSETGVIGNFDEILYAVHDDALNPELVITVGGHVVSKRIRRMLRQCRPLKHWHVSEYGEMADLFMSMTRLVECRPSDMLGAVAEVLADSVCMDYADRWYRESDIVAETIGNYTFEGFTDLSVLNALKSYFVDEIAVQTANSSVVRNLQLLGAGRSDVYCNRGVNGIDGSVSTASGFAAGGRDTILLTGDLSFFYDQNGLWNNFVHSGDGALLRIVLFNNDGGQIFRNLPGLEKSPYRNRYVAAGHVTHAEGIANDNGCGYMRAENADEFALCLKRFFADDYCRECRTAILEVVTDAGDNEREYKNYYHKLKR